MIALWLSILAVVLIMGRREFAEILAFLAEKIWGAK